MEQNNFLPYGNNIRVVPDKKDQILKTDTFCEHGKIVAIGDEVKGIKIGDEISFWLFGVKEVEHDDERHFLIPNDPRFILEVKRN